ncbi:hypothetical protein [Pseudomonas protegens]|uniref:hypothetical protein n=1 Tax=Pseudomonas protegens TaxID=380021 RepID=UPI00200F3ACA|nr:hypothetical protein [Pseudomonas protegens]
MCLLLEKQTSSSPGPIALFQHGANLQAIFRRPLPHGFQFFGDGLHTDSREQDDKGIPLQAVQFCTASAKCIPRPLLKAFIEGQRLDHRLKMLDRILKA